MKSPNNQIKVRVTLQGLPDHKILGYVSQKRAIEDWLNGDSILTVEVEQTVFKATVCTTVLSPYVFGKDLGKNAIVEYLDERSDLT